MRTHPCRARIRRRIFRWWSFSNKASRRKHHQHLRRLQGRIMLIRVHRPWPTIFLHGRSRPHRLSLTSSNRRKPRIRSARHISLHTLRTILKLHSNKYDLKCHRCSKNSLGRLRLIHMGRACLRLSSLSLRNLSYQAGCRRRHFVRRTAARTVDTRREE